MDDEGNLLVSAVVALAAYGAFDLIRRSASYLQARRRAREQASSDEKAFGAYSREKESIRAKFDPGKKWNETTSLPGEYLSEMRALNFRYGGMLRRRNGWTDEDFEQASGDA